MSALRRVLRDGRDGRRLIVNIRGRGYCFVASVDVSGHEN
jgi:DNA-binding winged helix-turn-helix (wHTH) protein